MQIIEFSVWETDHKGIRKESSKENGVVMIGSSMNVADVRKSIIAYDNLRLNRSRPRKARHCNDKESLERSYRLGNISKTTYYRRVKELDD